MSPVLDFERYNTELNRQLLRRIGYTNGLHKIRRFARVVEYLYPIMPASGMVFAQVIIREENQRSAPGERQLGGTKYASGIIEVAQALTLLERFGSKISLSSQGYACHALKSVSSFQDAIDTFLLEKVIESDGECALNILRLIAEGVTTTRELGEELFRRSLALIEYKRTWAKEKVTSSVSQRMVLSILDSAQKTLESAINPSTNTQDRRALRKSRKSALGRAENDNVQSGLDFFYKHTVNPRVEWLTDLGCLNTSDNTLAVTERGSNLLGQIRLLGGWHETFIFLPLDNWLTSYLELPSLYPVDHDRDFGWRLAASTVETLPGISLLHRDHARLLDEIRVVYSAVKLANFNEADALSIYETLASEEARQGRVLQQAEFEAELIALVEEFPSEIFKLSKRRGRGLYVALKKSV